MGESKSLPILNPGRSGVRALLPLAPLGGLWAGNQSATPLGLALRAGLLDFQRDIFITLKLAFGATKIARFIGGLGQLAGQAAPKPLGWSGQRTKPPPT